MKRTPMNVLKVSGVVLATFFLAGRARAELKVGDAAPLFRSVDHSDKTFLLEQRRGEWTVLYFYPKSETPGCTKQACTYRDSIQKIRDLGADVFGISVDTVAAQKAFHQHHQLNFTILADPDATIAAAYGTKMPLVAMAKRTTFILDPELKVAYVNSSVDPVKDAADVAKTIAALKLKGAGNAKSK